VCSVGLPRFSRQCDLLSTFSFGFSFRNLFSFRFVSVFTMFVVVVLIIVNKFIIFFNYWPFSFSRTQLAAVCCRLWSGRGVWLGERGVRPLWPMRLRPFAPPMRLVLTVSRYADQRDGMHCARTRRSVHRHPAQLHRSQLLLCFILLD